MSAGVLQKADVTQAYRWVRIQQLLLSRLETTQNLKINKIIVNYVWGENSDFSNFKDIKSYHWNF